MKPLPISTYTVVSALGRGNEAHAQALWTERGGLRPCDYEDALLDTWIGRVEGLEETEVPPGYEPFDCRNNRLALLGLETDSFAERARQALETYGSNRVALFLGTSTAGIRQTERMVAELVEHEIPPDTYHYRESHDLFSLGDFVGRYLGLEGPQFVVSTACSSSAKVFAAAHRHVQAGLCDAAVVGGVDSLCLTTLYGFNALELISASPCRPWDRERSGLSIGEGAAFALVEPRAGQGPALLGYGESSDGHHIASPHPEGKGAASALCSALERAGLGPGDMDYVNLHGTATPSNDRSEDRAMASWFGEDVPCSSTKGWTGHTLGAAGALEAVFCLLAMERGFLPATLNLEDPDPELSLPLLRHSRGEQPAHTLSNSFGFGGTNCSLVFGRAN